MSEYRPTAEQAARPGVGRPHAGGPGTPPATSSAATAAQVDIAGAMPAIRRARGRRPPWPSISVFKQPVPSARGELLCRGRMGRTSITRTQPVERHPRNPIHVKADQATPTWRPSGRGGGLQRRCRRSSIR